MLVSAGCLVKRRSTFRSCGYCSRFIASLTGSQTQLVDFAIGRELAAERARRPVLDPLGALLPRGS